MERDGQERDGQERDGQDGNGVRLENFWQNFSSLCLMSQIKYLKTNFGLFFLLENSFNIVPLWSKSNSCMSNVQTDSPNQ